MKEREIIIRTKENLNTHMHRPKHRLCTKENLNTHMCREISTRHRFHVDLV